MNAPQPRKPTNPWMVIGWIILIGMVLFIGSCAAVLFLPAFMQGANDYNKAVEEREATP